jgi:hypothetical protein
MAYKEYWWLIFINVENGTSKPKIFRLPNHITNKMQADMFGSSKLQGRQFVSFMTHTSDPSEAVRQGRAVAIESGLDIDGSLRRMQHNPDLNNL